MYIRALLFATLAVAASSAAQATSYVFEVTATLKYEGQDYQAIAPQKFTIGFDIGTPPTVENSSGGLVVAKTITYPVTSYTPVALYDEMLAYKQLAGVEEPTAVFSKILGIGFYMTSGTFSVVNRSSDFSNGIVRVEESAFLIRAETPQPIAPYAGDATPENFRQIFTEGTLSFVAGYSYSESGSGPSSSVARGYEGTARLVSIDGVAIPGVPEPASWAMMIAGFGLAGAALRNRRSPAVIFA